MAFWVVVLIICGLVGLFFLFQAYQKYDFWTVTACIIGFGFLMHQIRKWEEQRERERQQLDIVAAQTAELRQTLGRLQYDIAQMAKQMSRWQ